MSPPAESSANEVRMIGWALVPRALRMPPAWMTMPVPLVNFTMAPGEMVSVTPLGTMTFASTTWMVPLAQVWLAVSVPSCQSTALSIKMFCEIRPTGLPEGPKLMMAHGTGDDNVHFANTSEMLNELIASGRYATELMIFPGRGHPIGDREATVLLFEHIAQFVSDNL